jgi:hypothetical protein
MLFIFSMPVLIRQLRELKTIVFLHLCLIHAFLLNKLTILVNCFSDFFNLYQICPVHSVILSLSHHVFVCLSVYLPVHASLSLCLFINHSICLSSLLSDCTSAQLFVHFLPLASCHVCTSVCLFTITPSCLFVWVVYNMSVYRKDFSLLCCRFSIAHVEYACESENERVCAC